MTEPAFGLCSAKQIPDPATPMGDRGSLYAVPSPEPIPHPIVFTFERQCVQGVGNLGDDGTRTGSLVFCVTAIFIIHPWLPCSSCVSSNAIASEIRNPVHRISKHSSRRPGYESVSIVFHTWRSSSGVSPYFGAVRRFAKADLHSMIVLEPFSLYAESKKRPVPTHLMRSRGIAEWDNHGGLGALGGPPEEIGHKVAAALVGTFLGILLCYGLLGPMASKMGKVADEKGHFYHVVRVAVISFLKGTSPLVAIEFARRAVPGHVRPSFQELENSCKGKGAPAAEAAEAPAAPAAA